MEENVVVPETLEQPVIQTNAEGLPMTEEEQAKMKKEAEQAVKHCPKCGSDLTDKENMLMHKSSRKIKYPGKNGAMQSFYGLTAFCKCGFSLGFAGLVPCLNTAHTPAINAEEKHLRKRKLAKQARKQNRKN